MRSVFSRPPEGSSDSVANNAQETTEGRAQEGDSENRHNGDKSAYECVFRETLSFLAAKD